MKDKLFEFIKTRDLLNIHKLEKKIGCSGGCLDKFIKGNRGLSDRWVKPLEDILKDYGYSITNDLSISEPKPKPLTKEKPKIVSEIVAKKVEIKDAILDEEEPDLEKINLDYKKRYSECAFTDEYKDLYEEIMADTRLMWKDKDNWKKQFKN